MPLSWTGGSRAPIEHGHDVLVTAGENDPRLAVGMTESGSSFSRLLNLLGVLVVGYWAVSLGLRAGHPPLVWALTAMALAAWAIRVLAPRRGIALVAASVMVIAGALVTTATDNILIVPVILGLVVITTDARLPVWAGVLVAVGVAAIFGTAAAIRGSSPAAVLGDVGGVLLAVLIGISRRQFRESQERQRQAERQAERAELLAQRSRAARDIHDVLAHSLGGLVLQLDAVEALLEAGAIDEAARRAANARALAADGLAEARRAVRALREDPATEDPATGDLSTGDLSTGDLSTADPSLGGPATDALVGGGARTGAATPGEGWPSSAQTTDSAQRRTQTERERIDPGESGLPAVAQSGSLEALVDAHRSFGGEIVLQGDLSLAELDARHADAVVAVVREALTNARRHAPRAPVSLSVIVDGDAVDIVIANPLLRDGSGIVGMRERFAELGGPATVEAELSDGEFVVAMHVPTHDAPQLAPGAARGSSEAGPLRDRTGA